MDEKKLEVLKTELFLLKQSFDLVAESLEETAQQFKKTNEKSDQNMAELKVTTTKFIEHFESFKDLETRAHESLELEAKEAFEAIRTSFNEKVDLATEASLKKVRGEMECGLQEIDAWNKRKMGRRMGLTLAFCGGILVASLGMGSLLVYKAYNFIPEDLQSKATLGKSFAKSWPKLSKKTQEEINQAFKRM